MYKIRRYVFDDNGLDFCFYFMGCFSNYCDLLTKISNCSNPECSSEDWTILVYWILVC